MFLRMKCFNIFICLKKFIIRLVIYFFINILVFTIGFSGSTSILYLCDKGFCLLSKLFKLFGRYSFEVIPLETVIRLTAELAHSSNKSSSGYLFFSSDGLVIGGGTDEAKERQCLWTISGIVKLPASLKKFV